MKTLTMKDEKRLDVIQRAYRSELTVGQAAVVLGLSERQYYRVKRRVNKAGWGGLGEQSPFKGSRVQKFKVRFPVRPKIEDRSNVQRRIRNGVSTFREMRVSDNVPAQ